MKKKLATVSVGHFSLEKRRLKTASNNFPQRFRTLSDVLVLVHIIISTSQTLLVFFASRKDCVLQVIESFPVNNKRSVGFIELMDYGYLQFSRAMNQDCSGSPRYQSRCKLMIKKCRLTNISNSLPSFISMRIPTYTLRQSSCSHRLVLERVKIRLMVSNN